MPNSSASIVCHVLLAHVAKDNDEQENGLLSFSQIKTALLFTKKFN